MCRNNLIVNVSVHFRYFLINFFLIFPFTFNFSFYISILLYIILYKFNQQIEIPRSFVKAVWQYSVVCVHPCRLVRREEIFIFVFQKGGNIRNIFKTFTLLLISCVWFPLSYLNPYLDFISINNEMTNHRYRKSLMTCPPEKAPLKEAPIFDLGLYKKSQSLKLALTFTYQMLSHKRKKAYCFSKSLCYIECCFSWRTFVIPADI